MIIVFFHTVHSEMFEAIKFITVEKYLNNCVKNKSELLFIGTQLRFVSIEFSQSSTR